MRVVDRVFRTYRNHDRTRTFLNRSRILESTIDNLLLEYIKENTGAEIAFFQTYEDTKPQFYYHNHAGYLEHSAHQSLVSVCNLSGMKLMRVPVTTW